MTVRQITSSPWSASPLRRLATRVAVLGPLFALAFAVRGGL